jgi:hypothetical protein
VLVPAIAVAQGNVIELENNVSFDEAAVNEPLSCVYNGFTHYGVNTGDFVLIIGAGPIGLLHAKLAKMAGAAMVMITDLSAERLEVCRRVDGSFVTVENGALKETVLSLTKGRGLDVCVTACPSPAAQAETLELMAMGGRVCFFGGLAKEKEIVPINTNLIHYKQLVVTGSTRASISQYRRTLGFISSGRLSVKELMHGPAAVHICKRDFGIQDTDILNAVRYHTTGKENMSILEKVIYLSDFIEPTRDFAGVDTLRELAGQNLDRALLKAFDLSIEYIISKNGLIHTDTVLSRNYILQSLSRGRGDDSK